MATAALHAFFDDNSLRQYKIVPNDCKAGITIRRAMQKLFPLDERQAHTYDCNALIGMHDGALAKSEI
jgi:hypothetical protein